MDEGKALYTVLAAHTGLAALVGTRIYPDAAPQGVAFPFVVYERSVEPILSKDGPIGTDRVTFQVVCWGQKPDQARSVAEQVRAAAGWHTATVSGHKVTFWCTQIANGREDQSEAFFAVATVNSRIS